MDVHDALIDAIRRADRARAAVLLDEWTRVHGEARLAADVLEPLLRRVGDEWRSAETFTVAQVYVAGKIAADALLRIADRTSAAGASSKGPVVLGNIEDDFHALGRKIVATFLRADGWIVHDLGNDVPPAQFVDKALEVGARVIGVSAMMLTTARNISALRADIDGRGLAKRLRLAVGGAVFLVRPELVREVGGDGTTGNALEAPALFDRLWADSLASERDA